MNICAQHIDILTQYHIQFHAVQHAMSDRTCKRCAKKFKYPRDLRNHYARKTPCAPIVELKDLSPEVLDDPELNKKKCPYCGRVFSSYDSMRRHVRKSCKIVPNEKNGDRGMELLYEHTIKKQQTEIEDLKKLVKEQGQMMKQLISTKQVASSSSASQITNRGEVITSGSKNTVVVDNKRIVINVFGKEDFSHITRADVKEILDSSVQNTLIEDAAQMALLKMAMRAYSDPAHPENLTCFLPNKKTNDALIHTEKGWEVQPVGLVITPMAEKSLNELFDKQPLVDYQKYDGVMRELRDNGEKHVGNTSQLRPILVRNKRLLKNVQE